MEKKVQVTELTKEELVTFFSAATYGCSYWTVKIVKKSMTKDVFDEIYNSNQCREEIWADVLLRGGQLCVIDNEEDEKYYITLQSVLDGYSKGYEVCPRSMLSFEEENEDMWDGYNLMQAILFGEIIYG
jgi:hypothetical protein